MSEGDSTSWMPRALLVSVLSIVASLSVFGAFLAGQEQSGPLLLLEMLATHGVAIFAIMLVCRRAVAPEDRLRALGIDTPPWYAGIAALMLAIFLILLVSPVASLCAQLEEQFTGATEENPFANLITQKPDMVPYIVIGAVILAPIAEELFFRQILYNVFLRHMPVSGAMFCTSLLFGLAHFRLREALPLMIMGLALQVIRDRTKSITLPILVHAFFNGMMLAAMMSMPESS